MTRTALMQGQGDAPHSLMQGQGDAPHSLHAGVGGCPAQPKCRGRGMPRTALMQGQGVDPHSLNAGSCRCSVVPSCRRTRGACFLRLQFFPSCIPVIDAEQLGLQLSERPRSACLIEGARWERSVCLPIRGGRRGGVSNRSVNGSPIDDFMALERSNGVRLVLMIDSGLAALGRVLKGAETLSSSVQKLGAALLSDQVERAGGRRGPAEVLPAGGKCCGWWQPEGVAADPR